MAAKGYWSSPGGQTPFSSSAAHAMSNPFTPDFQQKLTSISPNEVTLVERSQSFVV